MGIGTEESVVRFLSAFVALATIPSIYILGKRLLGEQVGLIAALIFSISPLQLFYGQEARMYSLLVLFVPLSIWAYSRAQDLRRTLDWAVWIIFNAVAIYSHIFGALLLLALDVDALLRWHNEKISWRPVIIANSVIGLVLIPWMFLLLPNFGYLAGTFFLQPPTIFHLLLTLDAFVFGYTLPPPLSGIALFTLLVGLAFLLLSCFRVMLRGAGQEGKGLRLLLVATFVPIIVTSLISQWRSMYYDRWLLESSPPFYTLLAWGIVSSDRRVGIRVCAIASVFLIFISIFYYFTISDFYTSPLRDAIRTVAKQRAPDELVVHTSTSSFLAGRFYDSPGNHVFLYNPSDPWAHPALMDNLRLPYDADAARLILRRASFWLVVTFDHIEDEQRTEKAWFDQAARLDEEYSIGGIGIYHYSVSPK
jgi:uncharacterized membrane protein